MDSPPHPNSLAAEADVDAARPPDELQDEGGF